MRVVVLGAGFGGLEIASRLAAAQLEGLDVVVIDGGGEFVFGFSKLDMMFGLADARSVKHPYSAFAQPGVTFVPARITAIDPVTRRVETDAGSFSADLLVVALGADLDAVATPGLLEGGCEFYSVAGAEAAIPVVRDFRGGRVVVGVTSTPFKCPPAPSEAALLMHDHLVRAGLRDRSEIVLVMPFAVPLPPAPAASDALLAAFAERGITFVGERLVRGLDPTRKVALLSDDGELPYDLFLGIPKHRAPAVVAESGLAEDGWIPVDPVTLRTRFPGVFAVGDVTSVGTPKAGVFAEGQGAVVADEILAAATGRSLNAEYDGHGVCYVQFGVGQVALVDVTFRAGQRPMGDMVGPSATYVADRAEFGRSRIERWFGRTADA